MSGFVQVWRVIVTRGTYLAKAVQGIGSRKPAVMDTHGRGGEGVLPLQQHPKVAPGQSWGAGGEASQGVAGGEGESRQGPALPRCGSVGDVSGAWLASAPLWPSLWT